MQRIAILLLLTFLSVSAHAITLTCHSDENTREAVCFDPKNIRANGDLRAFDLYLGGPKQVKKNRNAAVINCKSGLMELRDRRGVIFARDYPSKQHIVDLRNEVCRLQKVKQDRTLD